jgi:uncharacterized protein (UPF0276 family)
MYKTVDEMNELEELNPGKYQMAVLEANTLAMEEAKKVVEILKTKTDRFSEFYHTCQCNSNSNIWYFIFPKTEKDIFAEVISEAQGIVTDAVPTEDGEGITTFDKNEYNEMEFIRNLLDPMEPCACPFA